jgi:hypothetical protein
MLMMGLVISKFSGVASVNIYRLSGLLRDVDLLMAQPIMLRFQWVKVPPWELSVHPGSYIRLAGG